jgi:hypothetical protein
LEDIRPYSKSSLTLNEWRFNLSFSWVSVLFLNSWRVSVVPHYVTTHPPAIQKQHWHLREAQIEPPLVECECEWAFRIQAIVLQSLQILYMFVLRAKIVTIFGSKMVTISARNTNIYKICKLRKAIFPYFTTFRNQIFQF